jgi:hypothetical protein
MSQNIEVREKGSRSPTEERYLQLLHRLSFQRQISPIEVAELLNAELTYLKNSPEQMNQEKTTQLQEALTKYEQEKDPSLLMDHIHWQGRNALQRSLSNRYNFWSRCSSTLVNEYVVRMTADTQNPAEIKEQP